MNPHEENDPLEALLHEEPPAIEDHGFTARVVAALPARSPLGWLRPAILLCATLPGLALMVLWLPEGWLAAWAAATIAVPQTEAVAVLGIAISLAVSVVWGATAALRWEE